MNQPFDGTAAQVAGAACSAAIHDDAHGLQAVFPPRATEEPGRLAATLTAGAVALLPDWGIISVSGPDAVKFLHGQTTNDIEHQPADEARWNGYCNPKGRLLATGVLWRDDAALRYAVSRPLAEPLRKRLSMFVLRAKAKVEDRSDDFVTLGLMGEAAPAALRALGIEAPAPMRCARPTDPAPVAIGFEPVGGIGGRWWLVVPLGSLPGVWEALSATLTPVSTHWWRATEILAAEPRVFAATAELFVPQTLNWEVIGGVSFRKGCYPGQEIVARMHYRGKPKRRTFLARLAHGSRADADAQDGAASMRPAPGSDLLREDTPGPVGVAVMSAPAPEGGTLLLYEAPIETAERGGLRTAQGYALDPLPLPYPLAPE